MPTTEVAKMVSQAWKALPEDEREKWEELAREDKARYEMEKSMYTGPWKQKVQAKKRKNKDPGAPKRPMSAFLFYSNSKRAYVKNEYKDAKNAEMSRIIAQMWKDADAEEKKAFIDEEFELRQQYKIAMAEWKRQAEEEIKTKREKRENEATQAVREGRLPISNEDQHSRSSIVGSATDSITSMGSEYSTKMANDTFASTLANPYPPVSQKSSSSSRPAQNYSFSSSEYTQHNQHQYAPAPSAHYNPDQQSSTDSYNNNDITYRNPYGGAYQAPVSSSGSYDAYDRRYEVGTAMGYDSYGQPYPYGYTPQAYYQESTYY